MPVTDYDLGWEARGLFFQLDNSYKYLMSFYNSCLFIFGSDSGARNDLQILFTIVMNLFGAVVQGQMFGELADLIYNINKDQIILQEKIDTINTAMKHLDLGSDLQEEIIKHIKLTWFSYKRQNELQ